eukprot:5758181-Heterocapsa_arctica.AAC.1
MQRPSSVKAKSQSSMQARAISVWLDCSQSMALPWKVWPHKEAPMPLRGRYSASPRQGPPPKSEKPERVGHATAA